MALTSYHFPNEDEGDLEEVMWIKPKPNHEIRQVAISREQTETFELLAQHEAAKGNTRISQHLKDAVFGYRLGPLA